MYVCMSAYHICTLSSLPCGSIYTNSPPPLYPALTIPIPAHLPLYLYPYLCHYYLTLHLLSAAFYYCSSLVSISFADDSSLETIGYEAFYHSGIMSLVVPNSVTSIGDCKLVVVVRPIYTCTSCACMFVCVSYLYPFLLALVVVYKLTLLLLFTLLLI